MKMKLSLLAASAILAVGMTGCWTESSPTPPEAAVVAKALDGYINGATVCVDTDNNEATCEYTTTTNATGDYTIPAAYNKGKAIITGGIDLDTNATFNGILKAPAGSKMATPLTTLLADGMTQAQITTMLGLPTGTDLSADYRKTGSFNAELTKAAITMQAILGQLTAIFSSDASLTKADIMKKTVSALSAMKSPSDLSNIAKLTTMIQTVGANLNSSVVTTNVETIVKNLSSILTTVQATTYAESTAATETGTLAKEAVTAVSNVELSKSVTIANNTFSVGSTSTSFTQDGNFTAVSASASNTTLSFTLENNGGELSATAKTIDLAIMIDDANSTRELKAVLKGVTVTSNGKTSTIIVPTGTKLYAEGKDSNGATVSVELTDMAQDVFTSSVDITSINLTNIMKRIEEKVPSASAFANIKQQGTYAISFFIGGNVTLGFDGSTLKALTAPEGTLNVYTPSGTKTVTGSKFTGTLTVTN